MPPLTESEERALPFIASGVPPERIAESTGCTASEVRRDARSICRKVGVSNGGELAAWFIRHQSSELGVPMGMVAAAMSNLRGCK